MQLRKIGHYSVIRLLGIGSFGKVYLVESEDIQHFALKNIEDTTDLINLAQKEVQIYASLSHPNILQLHDSFLHEPTSLTIVFEYCPGGDLTKLIKQNHLSQQQRTIIIKQILQALSYLHSSQIIHRNIKPENILIKDGVPKIADFGSSSILMSIGAKTREGTQFYMAPEIFQGLKYDGRVDVWSLGILTYELLTGKRIFEALEGLRPPAQRNDFPSQKIFMEIKDSTLREAVKVMLEKDFRKRGTSQEVLDILNCQEKSKREVKNEEQKGKKMNSQDVSKQKFQDLKDHKN